MKIGQSLAYGVALGGKANVQVFWGCEDDYAPHKAEFERYLLMMSGIKHLLVITKDGELRRISV